MTTAKTVDRFVANAYANFSIKTHAGERRVGSSALDKDSIERLEGMENGLRNLGLNLGDLAAAYNRGALKAGKTYKATLTIYVTGEDVERTPIEGLEEV